MVSMRLLAIVHSTISSTQITNNKYPTDINNIRSSESVVIEQEQKASPKSVIMETQKCGGLSAVSEKDDHVDEVINGAKGLLEEKTGLKIASIDVHSYKKQMVAGMNYFVKAILKTEEGLERIAHVRIYRDLQQKIELTAVQLDKSLDDKIEYFQ